jgi:hypothetical protein
MTSLRTSRRSYRRWSGLGSIVALALAGGCDTAPLPASSEGESHGTVSSCAEVANDRSYLGCDFWPAVTLDQARRVADLGVIVANAGAEPAQVDVSSAKGTLAATTIAPGEVATLHLPEVPGFDGPEADVREDSQDPAAGAERKGGALHLTATRPIIVFQLIPLEGRTSSSRPAVPAGCFSFTDDASILLPTTAVTGSYRIPLLDDVGGAELVAVSSTRGGTTVKVSVAKTVPALAGDAEGDEVVWFSFDNGEVAEAALDRAAGRRHLATTPTRPVGRRGAPCRTAYVFLSPGDDGSFVDVILPAGANVTLDGAALSQARSPSGSSGLDVARVHVGSGAGGEHTLASDVPVDVQVIGYAAPPIE